MNHDPFKGARRQWKRYDPEPEDDGSFREWEKVVWAITVCVCVPFLALILGALTQPTQLAQVPAHHHHVVRAHR